MIKQSLTLLICVLLLASVVVPCVAESDTSEDLHLLWDIPFGVSAEEFVELAWENRSIALVPGINTSSRWRIDPGQAVNFLGQKLDNSSFDFGSEDSYDSATLYLGSSIVPREDISTDEGDIRVISSNGGFLGVSVSEYLDLLAAYTSNYGAPTHLFIESGGDSGFPSFLFPDNVATAEAIMHAFWNVDRASVHTSFANIQISLYQTNYSKTHGKVCILIKYHSRPLSVHDQEYPVYEYRVVTDVNVGF